ncbi:hypothetical protein ABXT06_18150 [Flavobacterium sp. UW10123]|uniref:hypothetical protein n=1 Tax=Flavobacterium sp. UW10123 TaxID=3230800 RepID=UPI003392D97B
MKSFSTILFALMFCLITSKNSAQQSIRLEAEGLRKGDTCVLYGYKNGMALLLQMKIVEDSDLVTITDTSKVRTEGIYMLMLPLRISKNMIPILYSDAEEKIIDLHYYEHNQNTVFKNSKQNNAYAE